MKNCASYRKSGAKQRAKINKMQRDHQRSKMSTHDYCDAVREAHDEELITGLANKRPRMEETEFDTEAQSSS